MINRKMEFSIVLAPNVAAAEAAERRQSCGVLAGLNILSGLDESARLFRDPSLLLLL
jgi:hypothetical protein